MVWLLSVSAFFCADNGFAGSPASEPLHVKSVTFLRDRHGRKRAGRPPPLFAGAAGFGATRKEPVLSGVGNLRLSVKLDDPLFCSPVVFG